MLGVLKEVDDLHHLLLRARQSGDVLEGGIGGGLSIVHLGLALAYAEDAATTAAHLALRDAAHQHEEEYQQQKGTEHHQYIFPHTGALLGHQLDIRLTRGLLDMVEETLKVIEIDKVVFIETRLGQFLAVQQRTPVQVAVGGVVLQRRLLDMNLGKLLIHDDNLGVVVLHHNRFQLGQLDGPGTGALILSQQHTPQRQYHHTIHHIHHPVPFGLLSSGDLALGLEYIFLVVFVSHT